MALLKLYLSFAQIEKASSIIFNTNLNRKIIKQLFEISGMDKSVHNLVLKKRLSMNNVIKISSFDSETFNAFILIFQKVKMGQNKQIEIIINSHEIALRDNISLYELLTSEKIKKIVDHKNPDENYKGNLLRNHLTKKRYPQLSKTYENHKKAVKDLKLEPEIKFE